MPDAGRAALLRLSAALGTRHAAAIRAEMEVARTEADAVAVEEVILQSHLFVGFPDALNALAAWREVGGLPAPEPVGEDPADWEWRGERVCSTVYGAHNAKLGADRRGLNPGEGGRM